MDNKIKLPNQYKIRFRAKRPICSIFLVKISFVIYSMVRVIIWSIYSTIRETSSTYLENMAFRYPFHTFRYPFLLYIRPYIFSGKISYFHVNKNLQYNSTQFEIITFHYPISLHIFVRFCYTFSLHIFYFPRKLHYFLNIILKVFLFCYSCGVYNI